MKRLVISMLIVLTSCTKYQTPEYAGQTIEGHGYDRPWTETLFLLPPQLVTPKINIHRFEVGEMVTCIYNAIYSWDNGSEFNKPVPMLCQVTDTTSDIVENYYHLEVDCEADLELKWSSTPGAGLVKEHKLNPTQLWFGSDNCYELIK